VNCKVHVQASLPLLTWTHVLKTSMSVLTHLLAVKLTISYGYLLTASLLQRKHWMNAIASSQGQ